VANLAGAVQWTRKTKKRSASV